jgi:hypothetical protein
MSKVMFSNPSNHGMRKSGNPEHRMNAEWHRANPMPKRARDRQRLKWHLEHQRYCQCRPIPASLRGLMQGTSASSRSAAAPTRHEIRELLSGGDRRSIANSGRVRLMVECDPSLVGDLVALTSEANWLVAQRALDLLEKLAHDHPEWISPVKRVFLGPLADSDKWEIRLQVVRALPLFRWTPGQSRRVEQILVDNVSFPQTFVKAWALDGLSRLADRRPRLRPLVERHLRAFERGSSKALQARARQIRARLEGSADKRSTKHRRVRIST